jgi:hypothetical protein
MQIVPRTLTAACFGLLFSACGGNGYNAAAPSSANFDLQTGIAKMVTNGLSANVSLSGMVSVNGVSTTFTGSGTFTRAPAVNATFNGTAASSQTTTVAGTITTAGQTAPYSTSVTDYYASSDDAFLGEVSGSEYDVAQTPLIFPTMVVGGSSGILGTLSRYTNSSMSVSLGTAQVSYSVMAPVDPGSPIGVVVTTKIFDTQNTLIETDVTNYTMTSSSVIALSSASAQNQSGTLMVTAQ